MFTFLGQPRYLAASRQKLLTGLGLVAVCLLCLAVFWFYLESRLLICGCAEANKHLLIWQHFHATRILTGWLSALNTELYPPLPYALAELTSLLTGTVSESTALLSLAWHLPLMTWGAYRLGRLVSSRLPALVLAFMCDTAMVLAVMRYGFISEGILMAWIAPCLYFLYRSRGFSRFFPALMAGLFLGLGMLIKFTFPLYVAGAWAGEALWACLQAKRASQSIPLRHSSWRAFLSNLPIAIISLGAVCLVALPWYLPHLSVLADYAQLSEAYQAEQYAQNRPGLLQFWWHSWQRAFPTRLDLLEYLRVDCRIFYNFLYCGMVMSLLSLTGRGCRRNHIPFSLLLNGACTSFVLTLDVDQDPRYFFPLFLSMALLALYWCQYLRWGKITILTMASLLSLSALLSWLSPPGFPSSAYRYPHLMNLVSKRPCPPGAGLTPQEQLARQVASYLKKGYTLVLVQDDKNRPSLESHRICYAALLTELTLLLGQAPPVIVQDQDIWRLSNLQDIHDDTQLPPALESTSTDNFLVLKCHCNNSIEIHKPDSIDLLSRQVLANTYVLGITGEQTYYLRCGAHLDTYAIALTKGLPRLPLEK